MSSVRIASAVWLIAANGGLIVMASAFVALYGAAGAGCALGWHRGDIWGVSLLTVVLTAIWATHLGGLAVLQWYAAGLFRRASGPDEGAARFVAGTTCLVAAAGLVATLVIGLPVLVLPPCA